MPTNDELELAQSFMELATMLLLLPSSPSIAALMVMIFNFVSILHSEVRSREHTGYLGRRILQDPHESSAMRIIKYGDDRAMKKFISLSRGLFQLLLVDFGCLLARRGPGTSGRVHEPESCQCWRLTVTGRL